MICTTLHYNSRLRMFFFYKVTVVLIHCWYMTRLSVKKKRELACKTIIQINLFVESAVCVCVSVSDVPSVIETKTLNW